ncbi:MAG: Nif3-like dinuclear metal center hexameric protein [Oscillospiraceae bacterium]|nr:Nif3-like dinuclear metal center hexameric protein [Oscillospiraceae bacterium]MDY4191956.1 Nif3-like dinuclear metal center hexameric protein [Oscillospiraceae bacterium]
MICIGDIQTYIGELAPFETAESWDNSGLLVGSPELPVTRVLTALDAAPAVIARAAELGAELIVTHHPLIFHPLRSVPCGSPVWEAVRAGVSVLSAHTNLDAAPGGVNDALARALGLSELSPLPGEKALGRIGSLKEPMAPERFAAYVKEKLSCGGLRYVPGRRPVRRVGLCSGAGGGFLAAAAAAGADAFVTGDVKHDQLLTARALGVTLVDAGHFATERVMVPELARRLKERFPGLRVEVFPEEDPARYL